MVVVETMKKGLNKKKTSTTKENGGLKSNTATEVNGRVMMKSGSGSNGGSKEHRIESNGGSNGRASNSRTMMKSGAGLNGGLKESRVESASFSTLDPFGLSELHMEKSTTSTNGERWK